MWGVYRASAQVCSLLIRPVNSFAGEDTYCIVCSRQYKVRECVARTVMGLPTRSKSELEWKSVQFSVRGQWSGWPEQP